MRQIFEDRKGNALLVFVFGVDEVEIDDALLLIGCSPGVYEVHEAARWPSASVCVTRRYFGVSPFRRSGRFNIMSEIEG
jgi:hypothetical protein